MRPAATLRRDFLDDVIGCIEKRSRSLRYRGAKVSCERVKEIADGANGVAKRLNVDISYRPAGSRIVFRLSAWADRWIWIDVRRGRKQGWAWFATLEGRFTADDGAIKLVRNIEDTLSAAAGEDEEVAAKIEKIWKANLAQGPRRV